MNDEKLIALVRVCTELYDTNNKDYYTQAKREAVWERIAVEMGISVFECKKRWGSLRDCYRKYLRTQPIRQLDPTSKRMKPWRYESEMSFLRPFILTIERTEKDPNVNLLVDIDEGDNNIFEEEQEDEDQSLDSYFTSAKSACKSYKRSRKHPYLTVSRDSDPILKFFECMGETVKTFSKEMQIEVKTKVFNIVTEAEIRNLQMDVAGVKEEVDVEYGTLIDSSPVYIVKE